MTNTIKVLAIGLFLASMVFAKSESPPGEPPFGLAVQGDAKGTKLSGALFAEFHDCIDNPNSDGLQICAARFVLRLRRTNANDFGVFYGDTGGVRTIEPANAGAAQQAIINLMSPQVIGAFFGGNSSLQIKLKSVTEFGELGVSFTDLTPGGSQFVLTDLQVAVN
jgi:hypothetical protein